MAARADIAAAASTVVGLDIAAEYRQSLQPFTGFVKWNGLNRDDSGLGWIDTWQVWVALPQDVKAAEQWIATHLRDLLVALADELYVTTATPADLVLEGGSTNGLIIEGARGV
ncbi:hypothetical protein KDN32_17745 [Nocardioides sp. J2M5]|uniref:hypothetical protein n=1 Tax=Nocardioides palaemonis TaxID=2829810 RepID=UPI001BA960A0|nr:hypothetical protein [Nocardioides palaemonis]MBS2939586.1 hypothetical protein [Nocardioides palaemonis]